MAEAPEEAGLATVNLDYIDPALARQTEFEASFAYFSDRRLSVTAYDAALVLPGCPQGGGVIDAGGRLVACSVVQNGWPKGGLYAFDRKEVVDEEVVYLGMFYSCWGHVITDNLKHLWFRTSPEVDARLRRLKFVYTTTHIGPEMPENFKEMLRLLGLEFNKLVRIERPTQFRRVYVPEPCFGPVKPGTPYRYTKEYAGIVERLLSAAGAEPGPADRSVYFTRTGWKLDRAEGEKRIETVFRDLGYEIVRPETLSFVQMVRLLSRVRNFAATDGSCAHNALFLRKGARAVVIRKAAYSNLYQAIVGQVRGLETVYVDANRSDMLADDRCPVLGPFFLYVNDRLARFAGVRPRFPVLAYLCYALPQLPRKLFRKIHTPRK